MFYNDGHGVTHATPEDARMADLFHDDPEAWALAQEAEGWIVIRDPETDRVLGRWMQLEMDL